MDDKATLRRMAFAARKAAVSQEATDAAISHLLHHLGNPAPAIIAGYMAIRTEIDPMAAMRALHAKGHRVVVPVILGKDRPLAFHAWTPEARMVDGPFGARIPEDGAVLVPDILIAPLVGFDAAGNRLGYGGGFYDRSVAEIRATKSAAFIGFAYEAQELPALPAEPTDIPLDALITETGVRQFI